MVEIFESRPKKFKAISINKAFDNLLKYQSKENKKKMGYLYDRAKLIESEIYDSELLLRKDPMRLFWSTSFGTYSILSTYVIIIRYTQILGFRGVELLHMVLGLQRLLVVNQNLERKWERLF